MSLKQKTNDIVNEMDMDLKIAEEELTKDFDDDENEDAEFESYDDNDDDDETEEDKQIKRTRHGKPTPYAPKNGSAPHLKHLYANYGGEVMPYINMFDLQLSYETSDIELLYHLCERINKMIDIINAENKYINKLTDWTEKKIHKLFKHQKKFEKYLLKLLNEFEEQMQEEFSEFKYEITKEIEDFENLVNEELEAMNEEINRFENEMKERADAFEAEMKERADAFEAEMKTRADAFEAEVNSRLDEMDKEISDFEYEMKLRADNFENTINNTMSEFESEMRNRASEFEETMEKEQSNYENEMNTRATEFESSMSNRADNFETSISKEINDFKTETTNEINEFESLVTSTINDFSTDWTTKLNDFETYINHHIEEFESSMDERADSFEADLKEQWDDFKTKFGDMYNEYITDISNQWNAFKEEISNEWASEKEELENEMASYEETMNENYNEFKESIENYIEACCENVNNEISSFEETVNKLIEDFENEYNTRLEETTKEEVDAKITDIVNQSIYELIQNSEEFRNAISNVVNQLLESSEEIKEAFNSYIKDFFDDNFKDYIDSYDLSDDVIVSNIMSKRDMYPWMTKNNSNEERYFFSINDITTLISLDDNNIMSISDTNGCITKEFQNSLNDEKIRSDTHKLSYVQDDKYYIIYISDNDTLQVYNITDDILLNETYFDIDITLYDVFIDDAINRIYVYDNENIYYFGYEDLLNLPTNVNLTYMTNTNNIKDIGSIVGIIGNYYFYNKKDNMIDVYCGRDKKEVASMHLDFHTCYFENNITNNYHYCNINRSGLSYIFLTESPYYPIDGCGYYFFNPLDIYGKIDYSLYASSYYEEHKAEFYVSENSENNYYEPLRTIKNEGKEINTCASHVLNYWFSWFVPIYYNFTFDFTSDDGTHYIDCRRIDKSGEVHIINRYPTSCNYSGNINTCANIWFDFTHESRIYIDDLTISLVYRVSFPMCSPSSRNTSLTIRRCQLIMYDVLDCSGGTYNFEQLDIHFAMTNNITSSSTCFIIAYDTQTTVNSTVVFNLAVLYDYKNLLASNQLRLLTSGSRYVVITG